MKKSVKLLVLSIFLSLSALNAQAGMMQVRDSIGGEAAVQASDSLMVQAHSEADKLQMPAHPRLLMNDEDFEAMKRKIAAAPDSPLAMLHSLVMAGADQALKDRGTLEFQLDASGKRLLQVSRKALTHIYFCAYAYRFTDDFRYLEQADNDLRAVCSFSSWNPSHFLDVAEMATAVAIGYDWLYDALSDETKELAVKAIQDFAFTPATDSKFNWYRTSEGNWNQVCNGGLTLAALAIRENCPEAAQAVLDDALLTNMPVMNKIYAPDGNYAEGPDYWSYGILYEVLMLSSMESVLGTDYGLSNCLGFDRTADYILHCTGTAGKLFNYSDNIGDDQPFYPLWYFADKFSKPSLLYGEIQKLKAGKYCDTENYRLLPLLTLYASKLDGAVIEEPESLLFAGKGITPVVMARTSWDDDAMYLGIKGGSPSTSHSHLDGGSFVFDAYGVRWAVDLERQSYQSVENPIKKLGGDFWNLSDGSLRWALFRMNNRQHNTLTVNNKDHRSAGRAELLRSFCDDSRKGGVFDLTSLFGADLESAVRTAAIRWNAYLEVRDSLKAPQGQKASVRWSMVTRAEASLCEDGILLSSSGITMKLSADQPRVKYHIWSGNPKDYNSKLNICNEPNPGVSIVGFEFVLQPGESLNVVTTIRRFESDKELADRVFGLAAGQLKMLDEATPADRAPRYFSDDDGFATSDIGWWCSGFFPGSLWLAYEYTGDEQLKMAAERNSEKLDLLVRQKTDHDIGFQMMCSYGQAYRITGSRRWLGRLFESAEKLSKRFNPAVGAIKSWDFVRRDWQYPVIIDNMMNLELLTRASSLFRNATLRDVAVKHAQTTARNAFRSDCTSCHLVDYDPSTGAVRSTQTVQGYSDASAWARGQAWGLYGYTMMYRETGMEEFLAQACDIARMLLSRLPSDGVPYWDFDDPAIPSALKDASAAAIMASAFAELSGLAKDSALSKSCLEMARKQVRTLSTMEYLAPAGSNGGFLLKHCVGNFPERSEVDVALTYADYYYLEAVSRLAR